MECVRHKFITYKTKAFIISHTTNATTTTYLSITHPWPSLFCNAYAALSYGGGLAATKPRRRMVAVRAETINPDIRKTEEKVVDAVVVTEISKPVTAYCRCWRSGTFPLCDGSHMKHNKATGDNVGPLLLKKQ